MITTKRNNVSHWNDWWMLHQAIEKKKQEARSPLGRFWHNHGGWVILAGVLLEIMLLGYVLFSNVF